MKADDLLALDEMPDETKIIKLFQYFPFKEYLSEELYKLVEHFNLKIKIEHQLYPVYFIEISVVNLGTIRKSYNKEDAPFEYIFMFVAWDESPAYRTVNSSLMNKTLSDVVCSRIIPFMVSQGRNKKDIPLLIHDFSEFAKFAMKYKI
jgi:hypothetical protein